VKASGSFLFDASLQRRTKSYGVPLMNEEYRVARVTGSEDTGSCCTDSGMGSSTMVGGIDSDDS